MLFDRTTTVGEKMRRVSRNSKGFTLLEVLIVLVILAVVAGLAIPAYQAAVGKSRGQEAIQNLGALRESLQRYASGNGNYGGATLTAGLAGTLDFNPNNVAPSVIACFTYALNADPLGAGATTYILTATYTNSGLGPCGASGPGTVTLNQVGAVVKTGSMA